MSTWFVRYEGAPEARELSSAQRVLEGLRDGDWKVTDEVRGPGDTRWTTIEDHPMFVDAVSELEEPPLHQPDETHLDMNPMIDVALVLLVFFILTTTVSSLRRSIELPPEPDADTNAPVVSQKEIRDRVIQVKVRMNDGKAVIKFGDREIDINKIEQEMLDEVRTTGRKELFADVAANVPWGIEARIYDAAKGADIHQIYWPKGT